MFVGRFGARGMPLFKRIVDADFEARRGHNGQPPTRKAFVELTDVEVETLKRIAAMDAPLPPPQRITTRVRQPDPAAWGDERAA
jgi:hypothetical protein